MRFLRPLSVLLFALLTWAGQVTPDQAQSNYAAWYAFLGSPPGWLNTPEADFFGKIIFAILMVGSFFWFFWPIRNLEIPPLWKRLVTFQSISTKQKSALQIRFSQSPPHVREIVGITYYRINVFNSGTQVAHNTQVSLLSITPTPRSRMFRAEFPYRVTRATARDKLDLEPCVINPKQEELFEIAQSWISADMG